MTEPNSFRNPLRLDASEDKFVVDPKSDPAGQIRGRNREIVHTITMVAVAALIIVAIVASHGAGAGAVGGPMSPGNGILLGFMVIAMLFGLKNIYIQRSAREKEMETEEFKRALSIENMPPEADYGFGDLVDEIKVKGGEMRDKFMKTFSPEAPRDDVHSL